eukprot:2337614-Prymnesium_polylepis.1
MSGCTEAPKAIVGPSCTKLIAQTPQRQAAYRPKAKHQKHNVCLGEAARPQRARRPSQHVHAAWMLAVVCDVHAVMLT